MALDARQPHGRAALLPLAVLGLLLSPASSPSDANAHPLAPSLLEVREHADGRAEVSWKTSVLRVPGSAEEPVLPSECAPASEPVTAHEGQAVRRRWTIDCGRRGLAGRQLGVAGLGGARSEALIRLVLADGRVVQHVVRANDPLFTVPEVSRPASVVAGYTRLGMDHILTGPDHLLFVFGLLLLATGTRVLVETITAFTAGHSVTLSLAALGTARVPAAPVEVLIALSLFVLAIELARDAGAPASLLRRFPWLMAFLFGLLHGLGFAGALRAIGLPPDDIPLALFSFNIGIELGQIAFVAAVLTVRFPLRPLLERLPVFSAQVPVYGIGCLSAYWVLERLAALGH